MVERSTPLMPLVVLLKINNPLAATPIVRPPIIADLKSVCVEMCMFIPWFVCRSSVLRPFLILVNTTADVLFHNNKTIQSYFTLPYTKKSVLDVYC